MKIKVEINGELVDFNSRNFDTCTHRSDATIEEVDSGCCGTYATVSYRCKLLGIKDIDQMKCGTCKKYEKQ
jgi:hypothetical protein